MSIKIHFLSSYLVYFFNDCGDCSKELEERFRDGIQGVRTDSQWVHSWNIMMDPGPKEI